MKVVAGWDSGMRFDVATGSGHSVQADALPEVGGEDSAPRPKELLLASLATCTAMDVISVLRKMRQPVNALRVRAEGEETADHPHVFRTIDLIYEVEGEGCEPDRVARAVELSQQRYCGVSAMLRPAVLLRVRILLNGAPVAGAAASEG